MKYLVPLLLVCGSAMAGPVEFCNQTKALAQTQESYQPLAGYRAQIQMTGKTTAQSNTLPLPPYPGPGLLHINFQNSSDWVYCLDAAAPNNWCGTNPPTGTISNTAWVAKQASVINTAVSFTVPTTLWVSATTSNGDGYVRYTVCQEQ